jgi:hypothetical protein
VPEPIVGESAQLIGLSQMFQRFPFPDQRRVIVQPVENTSVEHEVSTVDPTGGMPWLFLKSLHGIAI